jgi:NAD(P)-dependent dehydrogenase (short-subunit alcohol dehydrogenase family)
MELARQGATLTMACRNPSKCSAAAAKIAKETGNAKITSMLLDTSSLKSVRSFAAAFTVGAFVCSFLIVVTQWFVSYPDKVDAIPTTLPHPKYSQPATVDMLFLNAGIASAGATPEGGEILSEDGIQMVFATNHGLPLSLFVLLASSFVPLILSIATLRLSLCSRPSLAVQDPCAQVGSRADKPRRADVFRRKLQHLRLRCRR